MSANDPQTHRTLEVAAATSFALARLQFGPLTPYPEYNNDNGYYYHAHDFPGEMHTDGLLVRLARWLVFLAKVLCLVSFSAVSYGIFYQSVMPAQHVVKDLHFDYSAASVESSLATSVTLVHPHGPLADWETRGSGGGLTSDVQTKHRAIPTATLDLLARHNEWQAYFDELVPQSPSKHRVLEPKQSYFIEVALTLPESKSNRDAGMFGVVTELYTSMDESDQNNGTCALDGVDRSLTLLARSRRSYRFPHQSSWISVIGKIALLVPLLVGAFDEAQTVASPAFRHYIESSQHPLQFVKVKILQHETATPVEAIGGVMRIGEEFSPFQEMLRTWFFTCAYVGTLCFCILYYLVYCLLRYAWTTSMERRRRAMDMDEPTCELNLDEDLDAGLFEDCNEGPVGAAPATGNNQENEFDRRRDDTTTASRSAGVTPGMTAATHSTSSGNRFRPHSVVDRDLESDDEWEDIPVDVSIQSDGIQVSSPPIVPRAREDESFQPREITDAELNTLLLNRLSGESERPQTDSMTNDGETLNLELLARGTEEQRCNPFSFFFR